MGLDIYFREDIANALRAAGEAIPDSESEDFQRGCRKTLRVLACIFGIEGVPDPDAIDAVVIVSDTAPSPRGRQVQVTEPERQNYWCYGCELDSANAKQASTPNAAGRGETVLL